MNISQGDVAHRVDLARTTFGVDGSGVKVCVISDGVDSLPDLELSGDLPLGIDILPGQQGSGDAGTAMLEIVHDLAPGADLGFATGGPSQAQMATNIDGLVERGCDIIVDDVLFFREPVFQDGAIARAMRDAPLDISVFFAAAGDGGNLSNGTSSVWEGDFNTMGLTTQDVQGFFPGLGPPPINGTVLDFGQPSNVVQNGDAPIVLQWADSLAGSENDYDLCLIEPDIPAWTCSTDPQTGTQDPIEILGDDPGEPLPQKGDHIIVVNWGGEADPRFMRVDTFGAPLTFGTNGAIGGHAGSDFAITVGAADVAQAGGGPFDGTALIEPFSSDGPRRVFFDADGNPFTPGDFSSSGGIVRDKPDIAAADGVSTATSGFDPFFGTSASAPHAAGVAALLLELDPTLSPAEIRDAMVDTAQDIEDPGFDDLSGFGLLDALGAVEGVLGQKSKRSFEFTNPGPGAATGLNIVFQFTGGQLDDPFIVSDTTDCTIASVIVGDNSDVIIDWGEKCAQPGATVSVSVLTNFLTEVSLVVWKNSTCPPGGAGGVCPEPPPTAPPPTQAPPGGGSGDVNCDGRVDATDAALVLQFIAGLFSPFACPAAADVDFSGASNAIDAALILQFVAGLLDGLPVGGPPPTNTPAPPPPTSTSTPTPVPPAPTNTPAAPTATNTPITPTATNTPSNTGTLKIRKEILNGDMVVQESAAGWEIKIYTGGGCAGSPFTIAATQTNGLTIGLSPGEYSVQETLQPGFVAISDTCQDVDLDAGEHVEIVFQNAMT